jgi:hypothetical protein
MRRSVLLIAAAVLFAHSACRAQGHVGPNNTLTAEERAQGWRLLFDGKTTEGWRSYRAPTLPAGWQVVNGELTRVSFGGDIITRDKYRDFELTLDWKVQEGGNSGLFYRAVEGLGQIYYGAPEMQFLDDARHRDGRSELTSSGANYGIHPAPRGVVKPAGEWNSVRLIVQGVHVEQWLNGQKVVDYELNSPDWKERVARSKFQEWPEYGQAKEGYIGLQDHGSRVSFRNIKIRVLP